MRAKILTMLWTLAALAAAVPAAAQTEPLTLRVNDMTATPGGIAAIVLRTYESRPIGQGQVCLRVNGRAFAQGEASLVTSAADDARHRLQRVDSSTVIVQFLSPTASVNAVDGPLAVLYVRTRGTLSPGQTFDVSIDLINTVLIDAGGQPIAIDPDPGLLTVRAPAAPRQLEADGDKVAPGDPASLFMETKEPLPLSSGTMAMRYDPTVVVGPPTVRMGGVYGNVSFTVDDSVPGLVFVSFESPDATLGRIPGGLVQVDVQTDPTVLPGTVTAVELDPALTTLVGRNGQPVPLQFEQGTLEFQ